MNLDNYLKDIKQVALKNRVYYMGSMAIALIIFFYVMYFVEPKITIDPEKLNIYHKENDALIYQNASLKDLVVSQQKSISAIHKGDSMILREVVYSRNLFLKSLKIKPNEISSIDAYTSSELSHKCAEIERQYNSSK